MRSIAAADLALSPTRQCTNMCFAKLDITHLCDFRQTTVEFQPGIHVILGENNAGSTPMDLPRFPRFAVTHTASRDGETRESRAHARTARV